MHGIYNYLPDTNHASRVISVANILPLQFMVHVMLFPMLNVLYFCVSTFRELRVQCPIWLFSVVP
jgi:hypothetical protein